MSIWPLLLLLDPALRSPERVVVIARVSVAAVRFGQVRGGIPQTQT